MIGCDNFNAQFVQANIIEKFDVISDHKVIVASWKNCYTHSKYNKHCKYIVNNLHDTSRSKHLLNFSTKDFYFIGDAMYKSSNHISSPWSEFFWKTKNKSFVSSGNSWVCLMSRQRSHRNIVYEWLIENKDIFDHPNYFVYDESPNNQLDSYMFRSKIPHSYHKQQHQNFLRLSYTDDWPDGDLIKPYHNSNVELVTETETDMFFVTEKTIKPIQAGIPFVVVGSYQYMKKLRTLGFRTFADYIDEDYDNEKDVKKRTIMACRSMLEYIKKPTNCRHIVEYNQKVLQTIQDKQNQHKSRIKRKITALINTIYGS